jgi:hypothetical protein
MPELFYPDGFIQPYRLDSPCPNKSLIDVPCKAVACSEKSSVRKAAAGQAFSTASD